MDFELSTEQREIVRAAHTLLERRAGVSRARELARAGGYDHELDAALFEAGFASLARGGETGALEAALVLEAVASRAGWVAFGASALVAPAVAKTALPGPIALALAGQAGPVRYGAHARTLLLTDGDVARVRALAPGEAEPVRAHFGYPMARVPVAGGEPLGAGSGERLRAWWRVALATEIAGTMQAALDFTVDYVKQRQQFGRAIGSFQALQHRLAECAVLVASSRLLAYEAAWSGAPAEAAAVAAAHASAAAKRLFRETHQMNGAIGFTREHALHVWSLRLQTLRLELEGAGAHRREVARRRWLE